MQTGDHVELLGATWRYLREDSIEVDGVVYKHRLALISGPFPADVDRTPNSGRPSRYNTIWATDEELGL